MLTARCFECGATPEEAQEDAAPVSGCTVHCEPTQVNPFTSPLTLLPSTPHLLLTDKIHGLLF
jgi:hypothetical protein